MIDPRTPVVIGAGQFSNRVDRGAAALEPVDLMAEALRLAAVDSGGGDAALGGADAIHVVAQLSWRYRDPGLLLAQRFGAAPRDTSVTGSGGNVPQSLVNLTCRSIRAGEADLVLITGAECWRTRVASRAAGVHLPWTKQTGDVPAARTSVPDISLTSTSEQARGIELPVQVYPLFEQAHRLALGRSMCEHLVAISDLWASFSEVAEGNPHAWIQRSFTPEEIRTAGPGNRMVGYPYTKLMCSNNAVEQGAGLIVCSAERAAHLDVPRDRWVFPLAGTDTYDRSFISNRGSLAESPSMRVGGRRALELGGLGTDDIAHVDLYSCFPSAVEIAAHELGFGLDRTLTVTGGLSFAGGPWNNYVTHSIATMTGVLREDPGSVGLVSANGGLITKHAFGLYSTEPPIGGFRYDSPQAELDALPARALCEDPDGEGTVETWTVMHDRDGQPELGLMAVLMADGARAWGVVRDPADLEHLLEEEHGGRTVRLAPDGTTTLG